VTECTGGDLFYRRLASSQAHGVIMGGEIAHQSSHSIIRTQPSHNALEERSLAGSWA
jgi:hypothetical protein